jgi:hypothetical protein
VYPVAVARVFRWVGFFLVGAALAAAPARGDRADRAADLAAAGRLLSSGAWDEAAARVAPLIEEPSLLHAERAEAYRIHGLALFFLDRRDGAESSLRRYLELEPDAHLDPALYPPEAVVFLEDVRTRSAKPPPRRRRSPGLSLLPPLGQVQNGDRGKAWAIGIAGVALLGANLTTYAMLASSCREDRTCDRDPAQARVLRVANLTTGALLVGVWAYGVVDGLVGYRRMERTERGWRLSAAPAGASGAVVAAFGAF